jgi:murein DD-endopeptidase MepM/ murein hydrolase activator NlpD
MKRREYYEEQKLKKLVYVFSIALILSIVIFLTIFVMYNQKLKSESNESLLELSKMNDIVSNDDLKETSYSDDLSVSSMTNSTTNKVAENKANNNVTNTSKNFVNKVPQDARVDTTNTASNTTNTTVEEVVKKELSFMAPVSGEIIKDFAMDTLVYSNTLEEWTTHSGIDIKADKTTIVVAAEEGTVESIKNDPRYGLTITISHSDGFKTIYSNLLTTEFVTENEKVEKGQTIATVGDSSSFEVADESHLHFEMYKDSESVNPTIYLK